MSALLRLVIGLALGALALPWAARLLWAQWQILPGPLPLDPAAVGVGAALGILWACWQRPNLLLHTLLHESAHALVCLLLRVRLRGFAVSDGQGGAVQHDPCDPLRGTLIAIAPYTLPLLALPALAARWALPDEPAWLRPVTAGLCAWLLIHHLHGLLWNLRLNYLGRDSDFAHSGRILGLVLVLLGLALLAWLSVAVLWLPRQFVLPWES
jgi:hypothetical protein